jgi:hypothetical protein
MPGGLCPTKPATARGRSQYIIASFTPAPWRLGISDYFLIKSLILGQTQPKIYMHLNTRKEVTSVNRPRYQMFTPVKS